MTAEKAETAPKRPDAGTGLGPRQASRRGRTDEGDEGMRDIILSEWELLPPGRE
jgi:hypothetical protein